jgi:hypothetical protein
VADGQPRANYDTKHIFNHLNSMLKEKDRTPAIVSDKADVVGNRSLEATARETSTQNNKFNATNASFILAPFRRKPKEIKKKKKRSPQTNCVVKSGQTLRVAQPMTTFNSVTNR